MYYEIDKSCFRQKSENYPYNFVYPSLSCYKYYFIQLVYKEWWCSGFVSGIMTTFITTSSDSAYGSDENILSFTFFLGFWLLYIYNAQFTPKGLPNGVYVCVSVRAGEEVCKCPRVLFFWILWTDLSLTEVASECPCHNGSFPAGIFISSPSRNPHIQ